MFENILVPAEYNLNATFGVNLDPQATVDGFSIPDPGTLCDENDQVWAGYLKSAVPPIDPDYQFRAELVRQLRYWWRYPEEVLLLFGPSGSGKTSLIEQWCARLGVPHFMVKGHRRFEPLEAFGQFVGGENGSTPWVDGPITLAARFGLPVTINEFDRIAADRAIVFNDVFEGRAFPIPGKSGEVVIPQPGFKLIATANSNLVEDLSGNYGTAQSHDISILERLVAVRVDYPDADTEKEVLRRELSSFEDKYLYYWLDQEGVKLATENGLKEGSAVSREELINGFVLLAQKIREQSKDGGNSTDSALERTMSTRTLRRWVRSAMHHVSVPATMGKSALHMTLDRHLGMTSTESTRLALHQAVEAVFGVAENLVQ